MIGQMPRWRPLSRRRRTLPYTLPRRARKRFVKEAHERGAVDTGVMLFESSNELPQATVVREPDSVTELVVSGVAQWIRDRWRWMRPRMIPLVVAAVGLGVTVEAVNHLARPPAHVASVGNESDQPDRIRIVLQQ
jgi:hypothetical protein